MLYLLRHGEAEQGWPDEERRLNDAGRREVNIALDAALPHMQLPDRIFHSGLVRARQTAELAAQRIGFPGKLEIIAGCDPGGDPAKASANLRQEKWNTALLVTHNPFVENLVDYLANSQPRIRTGCIVGLSCDALKPGFCSLLWIHS